MQNKNVTYNCIYCYDTNKLSQVKKNIWKILRNYWELLSKFCAVTFQEYVSLVEYLIQSSTVI